MEGKNFATTYHNGGINIPQIVNNPFTYRGYYYDRALGLYYLNSRYYDPVVGRFINADGYVSTGQGLLSNNMFAYCNNNPINRVDYSGASSIGLYMAASAFVLFAVTAVAVVAAACGNTSTQDAPDLTLPSVKDNLAELAIAAAIISGIISKLAEKEEVSTAPPPSETIIYRYYSSKTENLSPRPGIDYDGLSFSTKPPRPGVSAVVTTIEQVNATGILTAVPPNKGTHVTVIPTNGTVNQWMSQGQSSIWSQTLSLIVVEWDGGD